MKLTQQCIADALTLVGFEHEAFRSWDYGERAAVRELGVEFSARWGMTYATAYSLSLQYARKSVTRVGN